MTAMYAHLPAVLTQQYARMSMPEVQRVLEIIAAGYLGRPVCQTCIDHLPPAPLTVVESDGSHHDYAL